MTDIQKVMRVVSQSAVYIQGNAEGMQINYYDTGEDAEYDDAGFYCTGEETGNEYKVPYSEVDLEKDMFYKLVLVDTAEV